MLAALRDLKRSQVELGIRLVLNSIRKVPWLTILLVLGSLAFFYFAPEWLRNWLDSNLVGNFASWLLHPMIHVSNEHLWGNILFGLIPVGILVELWMTCFTRMARSKVILACYFLSLLVSLLNWLKFGVPAVGSSGIIFAGLAFLLAYYRSFRDQIRLNGLNAFAPILMGFVLYPLLEPFISGLTTTALRHLAVFGLSAVVSCELLEKLD